MLDSPVLCSLRSQSLLDDRVVDPGLALVEIHAAVARFDGVDVLVDYTGCHEAFASAGLLGLASSSRARRQERGLQFLKTCHGKHGGALGRSRPILILDSCELATAKECEHRVLGNREDELPTSGCCAGESGEPARRIRIQPQLHLHAALPKSLVGHDRAAGMPRQAVETENDCFGLRPASRTLCPDCPEPCGRANAAVTVRPNGVNPQFPGALAGATIRSIAGPY
jgi:hypothetical protein